MHKYLTFKGLLALEQYFYAQAMHGKMGIKGYKQVVDSLRQQTEVRQWQAVIFIGSKQKNYCQPLRQAFSKFPEQLCCPINVENIFFNGHTKGVCKNKFMLNFSQTCTHLVPGQQNKKMISHQLSTSFKNSQPHQYLIQ